MSNQIKKNSSLNKYLPTNFSKLILFLKLKIKNIFILNLSRFNKNYLLAFVDSHIIHYPTLITLFMLKIQTILNINNSQDI